MSDLENSKLDVADDADHQTIDEPANKPDVPHHTELPSGTSTEPAATSQPDGGNRYNRQGRNGAHPRNNRGGKGGVDLPPPSAVLFLPNMSQHANERDLMDLSKRCPGKIKKTFMYMSTSAHHGFLECDSVDDASRILDWINNSFIEVRGKRVFAEYSRRKTVEDRMTYEHRQTLRKEGDTGGADNGPYRRDPPPSDRRPYRQHSGAPYRDDRRGGRHDDYAPRRRSRSPPQRSPPRYAPPAGHRGEYEDYHYPRGGMDHRRAPPPASDLAYDYHRSSRYEPPSFAPRGPREYDDYPPRHAPSYDMPSYRAGGQYEDYARPPPRDDRHEHLPYTPAASYGSYHPEQTLAPYQPKPAVSHPLMSFHPSSSGGSMPPVRPTTIGTRIGAPTHNPYPYK